MGERFPVTAVTSVTETPVRPCEAVCAAFSGWADKVTHNWRYRPRSAYAWVAEYVHLLQEQKAHPPSRE